MKKNIAIIVLALLFVASLALNVITYRAMYLDWEVDRDYDNYCPETVKLISKLKDECVDKSFPR